MIIDATILGPIVLLVVLTVRRVRRGRPAQPRRSPAQIAAPRPRTLTSWNANLNRQVRSRGRRRG